MPSIGAVRAGVTSTFRTFLARYPGVSAEQLIAAAGIDARRIGDRDASIDQLQWVSLLEAAAEATGDPCFGIELALQTPWHDLGVLGYVVQNSPTAGAALENAARYLAVQQTGGRLVLDAGARAARFTYSMVDARIRDYGQNAEGLFAMAVRIIREATRDPRWAPREVQFAHAGPHDTTRHRTLFGAPVAFGRRANTLALAAHDLALPFVSADANLLPVLVAHARECMNRIPRAELTDDVRGALISAINAGEPSIEAVAVRLGMSPRSLQRRLASGASSFKTIVEQTRRALAEGYLADPALSLTETAFLLGYSDLSAFSRAFRRWTGTTAQEFRKHAGA